MNRDELIDKAHEAIRAGMGQESLWTAEAVVNVVLPQITDPKQLAGVPERSLLIDTDGTPYVLFNGELLSDEDSFNPEVFFADMDQQDSLPLTVVWQP